ncbi:dTDP-4-dehydrorhamnose 3,5-epimerase [Weeksellaceae bacterium KMM 9724]|uniref:dTDP-4-dehydrorhamnose 3,5-epimerase n=1 Tax=Profundicola chukchiensis TaxID=2961959 RepID=UPI00243C9028|nr:dTDP-4-dehydrorhamnose 3,5-epimerase [Profundicola chukchiensis]MDG4949429.1 dTDP-4-dehydrorhamnose 3,5-epimerase [Profundicola chukchiensis]
MKITQTKLEGCFIVKPQIFKDERGYFFESYNFQRFKEATGIDLLFMQDNQAKSQYGVIRGLHLQRKPSLQTKFLRVLEGEILDVAVDVRKDSPTYGQHVAVELSAENNLQLYIPHGFAHGYSVLSETAVVAYKCDAFYDKDAEDGIYLFDEDLNIDWGIPKDKAILSEKDLNQKLFSDFKAVEL